MNHTAKSITPAALVAALALCAWSRTSPAEDAAAAGAAAGAQAQAQAAQAQAQASQAQSQAAQAQAGQADLQKRLEEARRQLDAAARQVAELSSQLGAREGERFVWRNFEGPAPRAMIGVQISNDEGQGGAKVIEVSPGGPAADAGIKSGDIITAIGGEDLTKDSNPSRALVEKMAQIDPDLKVQVGVLRDGRKLNLDVTPRRAPQNFIVGRNGNGPQPFTMPLPRGGVAPMPGVPNVMGPIERGERVFINRMDEGGMGTRFRGIEFATLSEKLGSYFGVKSGVLVVRAGNNPAFKLQDGDVIVSIDGRAATSAQHAGRILRSYQPGEKLTIRVQRDHKAVNLEVTAPGGADD
jgi:C-terminal processing protease CtpA/Prc